ncbi:MAG: EAL domain-containing protein [Magnetococcus sp. DMHC-6]
MLTIKSLKLKFILIFIFLLLLGLGGSGVVSFYMTEQALVESAILVMDNKNIEIRQRSDLFHAKAKSDLIMAIEHPVFKEYFSIPESRSALQLDAQGVIQFSPRQRLLKQTMDNWVLSLQKRLPIVETCLIDKTGQEHTRITQGRIASDVDYSNSESTAPFFKPTMAMIKSGEVYVQSPYMSPDVNQWVFSYTAPIFLEDGSKPALFHYELPLSLFQKFIREEESLATQKGDSRFLILDDSGLIVADSQQEISLDLKPEKTSGIHTPNLVDYLPSALSISNTKEFRNILIKIAQEQIGTGQFSMAGETHYIAYRPLHTFGWSVVHIRPYHSLLEGKTTLTKLALSFAMIVVITLMGAVFIVWVWVGRMIEPLQALTQSAQKISNGHLNTLLHVKETRVDELGILTKAFNQMVLNLSQTTESKLFTDNVLEAMVDGLLVLDVENRIQRVNPAILIILGEDAKDLVGRPFDQLLPDHAFSAELYRDLLTKGTIRARETEFITHDNRIIPVSISCNLLYRVANQIVGMVILVVDIRQRKADEMRLHFMANFDLLTKLPNRNLVIERLNQAMTRAPWRKKKLGIMVCNLDRFKVINDTLGHRAGDQLLQETASRLQACVREGDSVARLGADEFVILLLDIAKSDDAIFVAEKVLHTSSKPVLLEKGEEIYATFSTGISLFPDNGSVAEILLKNATLAMHHAKAMGKNRYSFYSDDLNKKAGPRLSLESALRRAIERGEMEAHYQPRLHLATGRIGGAEALIRWRRPDIGLVSPGDFLPLAEETGLIDELDIWILNESCRQARSWLDAGYPPLRISVNVSDRLFRRPDLIQQVNQALDRVKLSPSALELELTEAIVMDEMSNAIYTLKTLREMWIHLAVDDFGTGYSSFAHLRRLPVHVLKIDRSFICEISQNSEDAAITKAIIDMAHILNLTVTAEGVETKEQLKILTELKCDEIQGFLFGRPLPADQFVDFFKLNLL